MFVFSNLQKIKHPFKAQITQSQILQFLSCEVHAFILLFSGWEHQVPKWMAWLQVVYQITMITLFSSFYMKGVRARKAAKLAKKDAKKTL